MSLDKAMRVVHVKSWGYSQVIKGTVILGLGKNIPDISIRKKGICFMAIIPPTFHKSGYNTILSNGVYPVDTILVGEMTPDYLIDTPRMIAVTEKKSF